jgi:pimeloyl-ACP methyl ester carboxylesterase
LAYLAAFNSGDPDEMTRFVAAHFAPSLFESAPAETYAWWHVVAQRVTGGLGPVRVEETGPCTMRVVAEPQAPLCPLPAGCQITIAVRDQAPHTIGELSIAPLLPSGSSVDIGGRCLAYTQMGTGSPTVVLEAGWAWGRWSWNWIIQGIAQSTRVIAYDRAGIGESDPVPSAPRSAKHMADDLATLLAKGGIPGPYVLVGHSFGGLIVRVFARDHPNDVVGMVLIDAVHEDAWGGREQTLVPPETPDEQAAVREWRRWLTTGMYAWDTLPEYLDAVASVAEGRACGPLGDRPLVVFRAGNYGAPPDLPQDIAAAIEQLRQEIHSSFTRLSSHSSYIVAERSGHIVQYDEPELVLDAIRGIVDAIRAGLRDDADAEE